MWQVQLLLIRWESGVSQGLTRCSVPPNRTICSDGLLLSWSADSESGLPTHAFVNSSIKRVNFGPEKWKSSWRRWFLGSGTRPNDCSSRGWGGGSQIFSAPGAIRRSSISTRSARSFPRTVSSRLRGGTTLSISVICSRPGLSNA